MLFSYNWLQSFFKKKLPKPEKLAEILTMHFAEVEEVKKAGKDFTLDIDVRPNRAGDCFSHFGIAREIAAITGSIFRGRTSEDIKEDEVLKAKDFVKVEVREKEGCPRYTARVIVDVKIGPSPEWIRDRLEVCGLRPINNIVDIVNYVMLETGQPLHAFDFEKTESVKIKNRVPQRRDEGEEEDKVLFAYQKSKIKNIIVRKAKEGERIITLDDEKYDINEDILIIADLKEPLAIAGIKGGKRAEIEKSTKNIILESANFDPKIIRKGSRILNLKTDASLRFEHGIDPNLTESAINRAAYLIQEIAKGKPAQGLIDVYPKKILPKRIKLDLNYVKSLLGVEIPKAKIKNILKSLGFQCNEERARYIEVLAPTFRLDISIPEDLIEEIGRLYGYEKIQASFPIAALIPPKRNLNVFWEGRTKDILKEAGFSEVYNYSFVSNLQLTTYNLQLKNVIEIENPTSADYQYLRPSLIPNLLKNAEKNQKNFSEMKIFELGKVFYPKEIRMLTGLITGQAFYEAKGVIDLLLNKLGISDIYYDEYKPTPEESKIAIWHPQRSAEIKVGQEEIGFLGEISPKILDALKIEDRAVVFDINFEKLSKLASEEQEYKPLSKYPAAVRDIAILVPGEALVEEVLNEIYEAGGALIRDVDLFDIYEGEELPQGKKNLAFHIIYQAEDHTLSSKEIDEIQNKIIKTLEEEPEWQVRR